jgi:hypothetical protein
MAAMGLGLDTQKIVRAIEAMSTAEQKGIGFEKRPAL